MLDANTQSIVDAASLQYNIPTAILSSLINVESGGNATAQNASSSAYGYTQLTDAAASDMAVDKMDPTQNIQGGAHYLATMRDKFGGDWIKALEAYNQGAGGDLSKGAGYANKVMMGTVNNATPPAAGSVGDTVQKAVDTVSPTGWFQAHAGAAGMIVLGVVVLAVGLITSDSMQNVAVNVVKKLG